MGASIQAIFFGSAIAGGNWNILFVTVGGVCIFVAVLAIIAGLGLNSKKSADTEQNLSE